MRKYLLKDRIKLFVILVMFVNIIGGLIVYSGYMKKHLNFPKKYALDGMLFLSSPKVEVTKDLGNVHMVDLTIKLKNNIDQPLTGLKLVLGNTGLGYLESPTAIRFTHLPPKSNDVVFSLADLPAKGELQATIFVYSKTSGIYVIKTDVETDQGIRATGNTIQSVILTAE